MEYLSIPESAAILPGRPHRNTVQRWMTKGVDGIKLRSIRLCGRRFTTEDWCREFIQAQTALADGPPDFDAAAKLDALGV